jgi:hypothetical protein
VKDQVKRKTNSINMSAVRRIAKRCGTDEETVARAFKRLSRGDGALYRRVIMPKLHAED